MKCILVLPSTALAVTQRTLPLLLGTEMSPIHKVSFVMTLSLKYVRLHRDPNHKRHRDYRVLVFDHTIVYAGISPNFWDS